MAENCPDLENYHLSDHVQTSMRRRGLSDALIETVLLAPEQRFIDRPGRCVYQSRWADPATTSVYLIRVFVDVDRTPPEVVTAYRTSKVQKYWRTEHAGNL